MNALKALAIAYGRLKDGQGRIARRNARRAVLGAMRALRNEINRDFPAVRKPKPPPLPPLPKILRRKFDKKTATLFIELLDETYFGPWKTWAGPISFGYLGDSRDASIMIDSSKSDHEMWKELLRKLAAYARPQGTFPKTVMRYNRANIEIRNLFNLFWTGPWPTSDLELAAKHHFFLESRCTTNRGQARK